MKNLLVFVLVFFVLLTPVASAHIPALVLEDRDYAAAPIIVKDPEISYAYYGKLQGTAHIYKIESGTPFLLYASLLVPYVGQEEASNVEFHVMKNGEKIAMLHGFENWTRFYEPYGGDWYLQGPEYEEQVEAGTYLIEVHSNTSTEDYVLAIGKKEQFDAPAIFTTLVNLPLMKAAFYNDFFLLLIYVLVLAALMAVAFFLIRKMKKPKPRKRAR